MPMFLSDHILSLFQHLTSMWLRRICTISPCEFFNTTGDRLERNLRKFLLIKSPEGPRVLTFLAWISLSLILLLILKIKIVKTNINHITEKVNSKWGIFKCFLILFVDLNIRIANHSIFRPIRIQNVRVGSI